MLAIFWESCLLLHFPAHNFKSTFSPLTRHGVTPETERERERERERDQGGEREREREYKNETTKKKKQQFASSCVASAHHAPLKPNQREYKLLVSCKPKPEPEARPSNAHLVCRLAPLAVQAMQCSVLGLHVDKLCAFLHMFACVVGGAVFSLYWFLSDPGRVMIFQYRFPTHQPMTLLISKHFTPTV